jgi:hypothetical protein
MAETVDVGRRYDEASRAWPKPLPTLPQQIDWINDVLYDVTERYHIIAGAVRQVRYRTNMDVKPLASAI